MKREEKKPLVIKEIDAIAIRKAVREKILPEIIEALKTGMCKTELKDLLKD